jgi:hypothetical protein
MRIVRLLGVLALAGAPLLTGSTAAHATGGCSVDNQSGPVTLEVHVTLPPPAVSIVSSRSSCTYVSGGGDVNWSCTLVAGTCQISADGLERATCVTKQATCGGVFAVAPGSVIKVEVYGGRASASDAV